MTTSTRRLTLCAVLTALALAISVAEGLFPLTVLFPIPGLRLGLANLVTIYTLCCISTKSALGILVARCFLGSLLGGLTSLPYSLTGGLLAFAMMWLMLRVKGLSLFGVCIAGASAHNCGQILVASFILGSPSLSLYLVPLLIASLITGSVTAYASLLLIHKIPKGLSQ